MRSLILAPNSQCYTEDSPKNKNLGCGKTHVSASILVWIGVNYQTVYQRHKANKISFFLQLLHALVQVGKTQATTKNV